MVTLYRIAGRVHAFLMPAPQSLERFLYRHARPRILERLLDLLAHVGRELRRLGLVFLEQAQGVLDDRVGGGIGARLDRVADCAHDLGRQGHADRLGIHGAPSSAKNLLPRTRTERAGFPPPADRPWRSRARRCRGAPSAPPGKAMASVITEPQRPAVPVAGTSDTFPVRRVYCVGRNYAAHAREMGGDPTREPPFFFMKPADTLEFVPEGKTIEHAYPAQTKDYHFEIELVAFLAKGGKDIPVEKALDCVWGYAVGLDMTRRDLQQQAKDLRRPWELGKGTDNSGPVGPIHPVAKVGHPSKGAISLTVDGQVKQKADLSDMIWSVAEQISYLSSYFELKAGDAIFAGTPEGVGKVERGQTMVGAIEGLGEIRLKVV